MSRSRRKTPVFPFACCKSERESKKIWHSRFRATQRDAICIMPLDDDDFRPVGVRDASNPWDMQKDGKCRYADSTMRRIAAYRAEKGSTKREREALARKHLAKMMAK